MYAEDDLVPLSTLQYFLLRPGAAAMLREGR